MTRMMIANHMHDEPAYILTHDVERFENYGASYYADLRIENVPLDERLKIFDQTPIDLPVPIVFSGHPPIIQNLDFPVADNSWLVMSVKMLNALKSVGEFRHLKFPAVVLDECDLDKNWQSFAGEALANNYFVIQLLERLDIFDFKRSKFEADADFPDFIGNVDEYVFKIPPCGLPPIFHLKGEPVKTFISRPARFALKKVRATGIEYISLKGIKAGKGMFVDVPTPFIDTYPGFDQPTL